MNTSSRLFARESADYLLKTYLPRLESAVSTLPPEDLFWRPHDRALGFGNILLHLEGNVRQWILSGVGGAQDHRDRAGEFAAKEGDDASVLLNRLGETVRQAAELISELDEEELVRPRTIQGFSTTTLGAIFHVVEHFSWHCGQAIWIAKARAGADHSLSFYDDDKINAARNSD